MVVDLVGAIWGRPKSETQNSFLPSRYSFCEQKLYYTRTFLLMHMHTILRIFWNIYIYLYISYTSLQDFVARFLLMSGECRPFLL